MTTEKMTIHEALSELKVLNSRINKEIRDATFCTVNKHSNTKIDGKPIDEWKADVKAQYQKITDLIKRRTAIKKAVVKSNAVTEITIGRETMTVAEAIEYKDVGIDFTENLLEKISNQRNLAMASLKNNEEVLETKANAHIVALFGSKDNDIDSGTIETTKKNFINNNTLDYIDPINTEKVITELFDKIDVFRSKVDSALSVSNATTTIEISY